ncbi:MAG: hypothetical protein DMF56_16935 [Acidobacteria bacterium]|nr:MAG: hypothetical protein DMF56_16935 [Acidobacteriota bacterium]
MTAPHPPSGTFSPQAGRRATNLDVRVCCPSPRLRGEGGAKRRVRGGHSIRDSASRSTSASR